MELHITKKAGDIITIQEATPPAYRIISDAEMLTLLQDKECPTATFISEASDGIWTVLDNTTYDKLVAKFRTEAAAVKWALRED